MSSSQTPTIQYFNQVYMPTPNPDNLSFSAPKDWIQNLLDLNPLTPSLARASEFENPQIHNPGTYTQTIVAETSQPLSQPLDISEREGESAFSAPHKENVSDSSALSPSQIRRIEPETSADMSIFSPPQPNTISIHSEVAHTVEELTVANILLSMSGINTVVSDPIQGQLPSQASGGNLGDLPQSPPSSTPWEEHSQIP